MRDSLKRRDTVSRVERQSQETRDSLKKGETVSRDEETVSRDERQSPELGDGSKKLRDSLTGQAWFSA